MKIKINPAYVSLFSEIKRISVFFEQNGEFIHKGRNKVKQFHVDDKDFVIKSFKEPDFITKIKYAFLKKSKAESSYKHALILQRKWIPTPAPIAYAEEKRRGLIAHSYYISSYINYSGTLRELRNAILEDKKSLIDAFVYFTAFIHEQRVLPLDYSPGNILYEKVEGEYKFALLDVNRMKFRRVSMRAGCYSLRRLWGKKETIIYIARRYAQERGFNEKRVVALVLKYHTNFWERYYKKHPGFMPSIQTEQAHLDL